MLWRKEKSGVINSTTKYSDIITFNGTYASGTSGSFTQNAKVGMLSIKFTNAQVISVPAHGNISNIEIGTLKTGFRPKYNTFGVSVGDNGGQAWYSIATDGSVELTALEGTGSIRTIAKDTSFGLYATYILA